MNITTFIQGSAHSLPMIADGSVQAVITSPPYFGLRSYQGEQGVEWPTVTYRLNEWCEPLTIVGCDPECEHDWQDGPVKRQTTPTAMAGRFGNGDGTGRIEKPSERITIDSGGSYCSKCGGWRGGLGMEPSPVAYLGHLILCLREWRRVLRDDGVALVNLGDSYAGSGGAGGDYGKGGLKEGQPKWKSQFKAGESVKPKDLLGIPWLFAIAARADGWYLRSDIIWHKTNPMPESVTDRPTKSHEYIFLLTKSPKYFWDAAAIAEPAAYPHDNRGARTDARRGTKMNSMNGDTGATRNKRTVWTIPTQPTRYAHFATFPERLVEPMVLAASRGMDTVLDPFNGSGTTGVVAVAHGRRYIGVDISQEYLDVVTAHRFGRGVQMKLSGTGDSK